MNKSALIQSVKNTNHSKTDGTGIGNLVSATAPGTRPVRVRCQPKHRAACKSPTGGKRKLPYEEIRRLREQGLTRVAIAQQLGLQGDGVNRVLRGMGLGAGWHTHKREILADGKVLCYVCGESKEANEFSNGYSYCRSCAYAKMAMRSNQNLDLAIHIRNVWFRNRAKHLNIYYDLTDEQLSEQYVLQDGRCKYCGKPMVMRLGIRRSRLSASIERIIPDMLGGTYTIKNVVWVHFACNSRRWALTGERLKQRFPGASRGIEQTALERQLELPFPLDSQITVTNDPEAVAQNQPTIHVVPSFISTHEGSCGVCGLPGDLGGLMSIPGVPGHYCSVECVECRLFGPGRCRWCSFRLDPNQSAFCCEKCRTSNGTSPFGSGRRFALWLSRHNPRLYAKLAGREIPTGIACLNCADNLDGKRQDSLFCNSKCQHKFNRSRNKPAKSKEEDYLGQWPIPGARTGRYVSGIVYQI